MQILCPRLNNVSTNSPFPYPHCSWSHLKTPLVLKSNVCLKNSKLESLSTVYIGCGYGQAWSALTLMVIGK